MPLNLSHWAFESRSSGGSIPSACVGSSCKFSPFKLRTCTCTTNLARRRQCDWTVSDPAKLVFSSWRTCLILVLHFQSSGDDFDRVIRPQFSWLPSLRQRVFHAAQSDLRCTTVSRLELRERTFTDPCQQCAVTGDSSFILFLAQKNAADQKKINTSYIPFTIKHPFLVLHYFSCFWEMPTMV